MEHRRAVYISPSALILAERNRASKRRSAAWKRQALTNGHTWMLSLALSAACYGILVWRKWLPFLRGL